VPEPGLKYPICSLIGSDILWTCNGTENIYSLILVGVNVHIIFFSSLEFKRVLIGSNKIFSLYFSGTLNSNSRGIHELFFKESFYF